MNAQTLAAALDIPLTRAALWADVLSAAMALWGIDSDARQAAFLAQAGHESGRLIYVREMWGPTPTQRGYEGRADLGNTQPGDGMRFMGRGLIQVTGRANYVRCGAALGLDLVANPTLLEQPSNAALSAAWFWNAHNLNQFADSGDFQTLTCRINGGLNGLDDREALWASAKTAIGASVASNNQESPNGQLG
jgi:putative chitinase